MDKIRKVKSISIWIFIVPFVAVNTCLILITKFHGIFPNQQDVLRYVLTSNAPETKDNDFTWKDFQAKNNNELVAIFGNFINRVVVLTNKYYNGAMPKKNNV